MANVQVDTLVSNDAAVARMQVNIAGVAFLHKGSAKKHPNDPSVDNVGEALAIARAMRSMAADLEEYAMETNARHVKMEATLRVLTGLDF